MQIWPNQTKSIQIEPKSMQICPNLDKNFAKSIQIKTNLNKLNQNETKCAQI